MHAGSQMRAGKGILLTRVKSLFYQIRRTSAAKHTIQKVMESTSSCIESCNSLNEVLVHGTISVEWVNSLHHRQKNQNDPLPKK